MAASRHNEMMLNCLLGEEVEKRFDMWGRRSHVTRPGTGGWWRRRRRGWGLGAAFDRSSIILHSHHNNGLVAISNLKISDSFGYTLYTKENATKGKFSFTTENPDQFDICFKSRSRMASGRAPDQLVKLNMKHGVEAKTYEEIEKVEKLTPLEAQLRHLEHLSQSIADNFN